MITVRDLQLMLDQAVHTGEVLLNSEVRFVSRAQQDCSLEHQYTTIMSGLDGPGGAPIDRRYGDGVFMLAQEQALRDAPQQVLLDLDW